MLPNDGRLVDVDWNPFYQFNACSSVIFCTETLEAVRFPTPFRPLIANIFAFYKPLVFGTFVCVLDY